MESKRQHLACVTVVVLDYEEAKAYYCGVLDFQLIEDTPLPDGKRWVLVAPPGSCETRLLQGAGFHSRTSKKSGRSNWRASVPLPVHG